MEAKAKAAPVDRSEIMLDKFDKSSNDAFSVEIEGSDKDDSSLVLPVVSAPSPILREESQRQKDECKKILNGLQNDVNKDDSFQVNPSSNKADDKKLNLSDLDPVEIQKIKYTTEMDNSKYDPTFKANLINMMNMGFYDFKKNLELLQKHFNNLELVCQKILE